MKLKKTSTGMDLFPRFTVLSIMRCSGHWKVINKIRVCLTVSGLDAMWEALSLNRHAVA